MLFGNAFKPRSHYVYNYKPRYYDERKERLEKLKAKYEKSASESGEDEDLPKITLTKDQLRSGWQKHKKVSSNRAVNLRLAIIITILVGLVAYIFEIHTLF
ncbi:MAG: hypothetical protein WBV45_05240 [Lutimonas sp.]